LKKNKKKRINKLNQASKKRKMLILDLIPQKKSRLKLMLPRIKKQKSLKSMTPKRRNLKNSSKIRRMQR